MALPVYCTGYLYRAVSVQEELASIVLKYVEEDYNLHVSTIY